MEQSRKVKLKFDMCPVLVFLTNTGKGKSNTVQEFVDLMRAEAYPIKDALNFYSFKSDRVFFATITKENRDAMKAKQPHFEIVRGVAEILEERHGKQVAKRYVDIIDEDKHRNKFDILVKEGLLKQYEADRTKDIIKQENNKLFTQPYICMTFQKLATFKKHDFLKGAYVFLDEMRQDRIWTQEAKYKIWGSEIDVFENKEYNNLTTNLINMANSQDIKGVCFLSAEESLQYAIDSPTFPKFNKHTINEKFIYQVDSIEPRHDDNLTVCVVHGTSDNKHTKRTLARLARSEGYKVICDGKNEHGAIGDYTIEGVKGSNALVDENLCTIISTPHPNEIAPIMSACDLTEEEAIKVVISDKINQAVGRNTGHRDWGKGKHILVIPERLVTLVNWHTEGNIIKATRKADVADLGDSAAENILKNFYKDSVYYAQYAAYRAVYKLKVQFDCKALVKSLKNEIEEHLLYMGLSPRQITKDKLLNTTIDFVLTYGFEKKKITYNGKRNQMCIVEQEIELTDEQRELSAKWQYYEDLEAKQDLTREEARERNKYRELYFATFETE
ncbi:hypothetical protein F0267_17320 [Vibrio coralliilyticus]|uniref:Uncharacterized protein n=1 Tax=Vibrio coralliilyticus TaxID=190893 RepID=A0AAN0VX09_9VIBR|nr:hypothetical protein [Vibrio coralliilyticus]AIW18698.1 hypothetical protein IX92_06405 [Vibrio coralliilyticus]NOH39981.1 hypothetical protein [Vibrio coralliilyticus]